MIVSEFLSRRFVAEISDAENAEGNAVRSTLRQVLIIIFGGRCCP